MQDFNFAPLPRDTWPQDLLTPPVLIRLELLTGFPRYFGDTPT